MKALEERGIGRPSTYASILATILDRGYVVKRGTALVPTFLAFAVTTLLEQHYGALVDYDFTARMEDDLDRIAAGDEERVAWLTRFYKGDDGDPGPAPARHGAPRRDRRARGQLDRDPALGHRRARRPLRAVSRARRAARADSGRAGAGRGDGRRPPRSFSPSRPRVASSALIPRPAARSSFEPAATART